MDPEIEKKYIEAGRVAGEVREAAKNMVKPGASFLDIANNIEDMIRKKGADIAFPVNISVNEIAAHYTAQKNDESLVKEGDVVKLDIGAHIDGYVGDTAVTVCLNDEYERLCEASRNALKAALDVIAPGTPLSDVSSAIEKTITEYDYMPISNLTGHGLDQYVLHGEPKVLNINNDSKLQLKEDQVIAIEPFATNGSGFVKDSGDVFIFSLVRRTPARSEAARAVMDIGEARNGLPFTERWVDAPLFKIRLAIRELVQRNALHEYGVLKEAANGTVSQAEHTVIVKDKPIITTKV